MKFTFDTCEEANEFVEAVNKMYQTTGVVKYSDVLAMIGNNYNWRDQGVGWTDASSFLVDFGSIAEHNVRVYADDPVDLGEKTKKTDTVAVIKGDNLVFDNVNHPAYYKTKNGLETIQVIEAFTEGLEGIEATDTGNVIKYICRWKKKNGLEDLKKAQWYLNHLINHVEKENES